MSPAGYHELKSEALLHNDVKALRAEIIKFLLAPSPAGRGSSIKDALAYLTKQFHAASVEFYIFEWRPYEVGANEHHLNSWDLIIREMRDDRVTEEYERLGRLVLSKEFNDPESPEYAEYYKFKKNRDLEESCMEDSRKQAELARVCADTTKAVSQVWNEWKDGSLDYSERPHCSTTGMGVLFRRVFEETAPRDGRTKLDWELVLLLVSMV